MADEEPVVGEDGNVYSADGTIQYDPSSWEAVSAHVANGDLRFDDVVALGCMTLCSDLISALEALARTVGEWEWKPFGTLDSSTYWAKDALYQKSVDLVNIFRDEHTPALEKIFDTFKAAALAWQESEEDSMANFGEGHPNPYNPIPDMSSSVQSTFGGGQTLPQRYLDALDGDYVGEVPTGSPEAIKLMEGYESMQAPRYSSYAEYPGYLSHDDLYYLGEYLRDNKIPEHCQEWAERWWQNSVVIHELFRQFAVAMEAVTRDDWKGEGRDAAVTACQSYANSGLDLSSAMVAMGNNYHYVGLQMQHTMDAMPIMKDPSGVFDSKPADVIYDEGYPVTRTHSGGVRAASWDWSNPAFGFGSSDDSKAWFIGGSDIYEVDDNKDHFREEWLKHYKKGFDMSDSKIPVLSGPVPLPPETPAEEEEDTNNYEYTPGGGGLEIPGGGGLDPGALSPSGSTSMDDYLRQQQEAADAAEAAREEAAKEAEEAAREAADAASEAARAQAVQQALSQGMSALQGLMSPLTQMVEKGMQAAEQQSQRQQMAKASDSAARALADGVKPGGGLGGGAKGGGAGGLATPLGQQESKLFPRAGAGAAPGDAAGNTFGKSIAAGMAGAGAPMAGAPGSPGAAGRPGGGQGGQKDHERAAYLSSTEHMEDVVGDAPSATKAVVGAGPTVAPDGQPKPAEPTPAPAPRVPVRRRAPEPVQPPPTTRQVGS